jgi:hypothetical protein
LSKKTWELVSNNEIDGVELQLALQCAPLIAGLKISNLLNIRREDFAGMLDIVKDSHISWYLLLESKEKLTVLLYHRDSLEDYLRQQSVRELLAQAGYQSFSLDEILPVFCGRYQKYMETKGSFPHEMGLLLGYPPEDVEGFIRYKGDHCLCCGYWKVYANKEGKLKVFESFEHAKEGLLQLLSSGISMGAIVAACCSRMETKAVQINY